MDPQSPNIRMLNLNVYIRHDKYRYSKSGNHELTNKTKWEKTGISLMREKNAALSAKTMFYI
jgi:hypothetical protein